jgi:hypothetical protein
MLLAATALGVAAGGVVAVSAREPRVVLLGMTIALVGAPFLADPLPGPLPLAARLVAAALASYLLWIGSRADAPAGRGSTVGWPVEALAAAAGFVVGWGTIGLGAPALGPASAAAAGFALATLTVLPVIFARDPVRLGNGLILLLLASSLIRVSLGGTPVALEELVISGALVGISAVTAFLSVQAAAISGPADASQRARAIGSELPVG